MPAKSKSQQRLMGMVHACQKSGKCASEQVKKMAKTMKKSDAEDFAETKHKGLPERVKESTMTFREFLLDESNFGRNYGRFASDEDLDYGDWEYENRKDKELDRRSGPTVLPPIDTKRYQEREGLEGPFRTRSGKVVYYDAKEGKYYDPDSDFYLTHDEYEALDR